ncbi:hypothetical protein AVEN_229917-1 [Araneus ventricosus]|uniref:Uncharacterized protein n=1 Tax=Araneus ventricosus TaxID=182803 RepID=A0A4Y2BX14_ARAVE|nr:hypothetical protein AVEN_229917-1 [Araneus ventricosus]
MTRMTLEPASPLQAFTPRGLFWYPRLGWETSLFPLLTCGKSDVSQPNWGYQNRPAHQSEDAFNVTMESGLKHRSSNLKAETLPSNHSGL